MTSRPARHVTTNRLRRNIVVSPDVSHSGLCACLTWGCSRTTNSSPVTGRSAEVLTDSGQVSQLAAAASSQVQLAETRIQTVSCIDDIIASSLSHCPVPLPLPRDGLNE